MEKHHKLINYLIIFAFAVIFLGISTTMYFEYFYHKQPSQGPYTFPSQQSMQIPLQQTRPIIYPTSVFTTPTPSLYSSITSPPPTPTPPASQILTVTYQKRQKILDTTTIPQTSDVTPYPNEKDFDTYTFNFYDVGTVNSGSYKDGTLILAEVTYKGACKGAGCGLPTYIRYIKQGEDIFLLPRISKIENWPWMQEEKNNLITGLVFQKYGLTFHIDNDSSIAELEYPNEITVTAKETNNSVTLGSADFFKGFIKESSADVDLTKLTNIGIHPIFGTIYATKPEISPQQEDAVKDNKISSVYGCSGSNCFTSNGFFFFRPDGTYLEYSYEPAFKVEDIIWQDNKPTSQYISNTTFSCEDTVLSYLSVVSTSLVSKDDLQIIGSIKTTGNIIYGLKDSNHPLNKAFYKYYQSIAKDYQDRNMGLSNFDYNDPVSYGNFNTHYTYDEFVNYRPMFFWYDPFGRLVRFNNNHFITPAYCEPVIYLYPPKTEQVKIKFEDSVHISFAQPAYDTLWQVLAQPSGDIINLTDKQHYPYLFWDGSSYIFPLQKQGFVVAKNQVDSLLRKIMPKLGLNDKETNDFVKTWEPQLSSSPYYFITFLDTDTVNKLAPLTIDPQPQTTIRVFMDYTALDKPIQVEEQHFTNPPSRTGFTMVEWGGIKRPGNN